MNRVERALLGIPDKPPVFPVVGVLFDRLTETMHASHRATGPTGAELTPDMNKNRGAAAGPKKRGLRDGIVQPRDETLTLQSPGTLAKTNPPAARSSPRCRKREVDSARQG